MGRDGKLVIRPDSGDPVKIICGDPEASPDSPEYKGSVRVLWETFRGTLNSKGYIQLDPHIGLIYGDSITLDRCKAICEGLEANGFASTNIVFGIGSYTYQHVTRDTFGFAMKATYGVINGKPVEIYKTPKTDSGLKNSAKGLLRVNEDMMKKVRSLNLARRMDIEPAMKDWGFKPAYDLDASMRDYVAQCASHRDLLDYAIPEF